MAGAVSHLLARAGAVALAARARASHALAEGWESFQGEVAALPVLLPTPLCCFCDDCGR
jgi:hypothetical protein